MGHVYHGVPERMAQVIPEARLVYVVRDPIARMQSMYMHQVSAGRERRRLDVGLLDDSYLGPSLYGFQLAAFLDHFDRSQVLVIASEVLRDRPREALSAVLDHLAVDPAAVDLDRRRQDHRSIDKPVPRLHDLEWLPRRQVKLHPRWRPDQRAGFAGLLTTRRAPCRRPAPLRASTRLPGTQSPAVVNFSIRLARLRKERLARGRPFN